MGTPKRAASWGTSGTGSHSRPTDVPRMFYRQAVHLTGDLTPLLAPPRSLHPGSAAIGEEAWASRASEVCGELAPRDSQGRAPWFHYPNVAPVDRIGTGSVRVNATGSVTRRPQPRERPVDGRSRGWGPG